MATSADIYDLSSEKIETHIFNCLWLALIELRSFLISDMQHYVVHQNLLKCRVRIEQPKTYKKAVPEDLRSLTCETEKT